MAEFPFAAPAPLTAAHDTEAFDCGKPPLNEFLRKHALSNQSGGSARTFVAATTAGVVVGYYSLAATAIAHDDADERIRKGQPRHPVPAILMARFAVDASQQGKGLGRMLLRDALLRSLKVTDDLGARVFVVDAKDDEAVRYYERYKMIRMSYEPHRLYLLFKDVKKLLSE